ncbi:MAG: branched-chain amino acid ABC transporter permease [Clostridia bacterium]|nr:branched-chain amino acid ABC transporter permease [Clostridia bacterium]
MRKNGKLVLSPYKKNEITAYLVVVLFFGIMASLKATGVLSRSLSGQLIPIAAYMIMAVSLNLVVGISGELSLGHAGFMSVGAFTGIITSLYLAQAGAPTVVRFVVATLAGGVAAGIVGFVIAIPVLRLRGDYLAIVTLAFGEIIRNILNVVYVGLDRNGLHFATTSDIALLEGGSMILKGPMGAITNEEISTLLEGFILVVVALFLAQNMLNSRTGRAIMAIRDNRIAAESIGLSVTKYKMIAFVVSAVLAGFAGVLFGLNFSSLAPVKFGFNQSILILVFIVLGGIGNIWGGVISAGVLTILPEALRQFSDYRMLVYAVVLIIVMLVTNNKSVGTFMSGLKGKLTSRKKEGGDDSEKN